MNPTLAFLRLASRNQAPQTVPIAWREALSNVNVDALDDFKVVFDDLGGTIKYLYDADDMLLLRWVLTGQARLFLDRIRALRATFCVACDLPPI